MHSKRHRHFVAVPLTALLMVAVAGLHELLPVNAADSSHATDVQFRAGDSAVDFQVGWQLAGTLYPRCELRADEGGKHPILVAGQVLIRSSGLTELRFGSSTVHALAASYVVLREGSSSTVASLTAPVLVTRGAESFVVVPGMQLILEASGEAVAASIPPDWYAQRLQEEKLLPREPLPSDDVSSPHRDDPQVLLAGILREGRITSDVFSQASDAMQELDSSEHGQRLLHLRLLQESLRTDRDASSTIAAAIEADRFLSQELAKYLPHQVLTLLKPASESSILTWQKALLVLAVSDSAAALSVIHSYASAPSMLERAGYPEQSRLWQRALLSVAENLRPLLPEQERDSLDADIADTTHGELLKQEATSEEHLSAPTTQWTDSELTALARDQLFVGGVLLAVTSTLSADTPTQTVRVADVFIASDDGDVAYSFTLDFSHEIVAEIVRDGVKLPNAVPFSVFFR